MLGLFNSALTWNDFELVNNRVLKQNKQFISFAAVL